MTTVTIKDKFIEVDHFKYFRANANEMELCTWGEKKTPVFGINYVAPEGKIARRHLEKRPIKMTTPFSVDWSTVSEGDLAAGADLNFFGIGRDHAVKFDLNEARTGDMKLVKFYLTEGVLKRCLNEDANTVRNNMADEGKDARIVSGVWVVFDAELSSHFNSLFDTSHSVSAFGSELGITVSGGKKGDQTIKLGDGSAIAYELAKVKKWSKGKDQIEEMEDDQFGMN